MYFLLINFANLQANDIVTYAIFLFASIFAYTTLMDKNLLAVPSELIKLAIGIGIIYFVGGWYGLDDYFSGATIIVAVYLVVSALLTFYFVAFENDSTQQLDSI